MKIPVRIFLSFLLLLSTAFATEIQIERPEKDRSSDGEAKTVKLPPRTICANTLEESLKIDLEQEQVKTFHSGQTIADLTLVDFLGRGGFGETWTARWQGHEGLVAIKILNVRMQLRLLKKKLFGIPSFAITRLLENY